MSMFYTYMLRCTDKSIYTGITTDVQRRMKEHKEKGIKGAKYTKNHEYMKIECAWECEDRGLASKLEYQIKQLEKKQKEELILTQDLKQFLKDKVDCDEYVIIDVEGLNEENEEI